MPGFPLVSIIIPTYNRPDQLENAVESAIQQTYNNKEIIVVDDGSTKDIYLPILNKYPQLRYIHQENMGLGPARNNGVKASQNPYIQFLDDDDLLFPEAISVKVEFLEKNPQIGVVYSDLLLKNWKGMTRGLYQGFPRPMPTGDIYERMINRNFIPVHALLWRRSIFESSGGFLNRSGHEDWSCLIAASEITNFGFIDQPLGIYNLNRKSLANQFRPMFEGKLAIHNQIVNTARFNQIDPITRSKILSKYAIQECAFGDPEKGHNYINTAQQLDPSSKGIKAIGLVLKISPFPFRVALKLSWLLSLYKRGTSRLTY